VEGLGHAVEELLHHLEVQPITERGFENAIEGGFYLTNYAFFLLIAFFATLLFFIIAARRVKLVPSGVSAIAEAGVEFIENLCVEVIGEKHGRQYLPLIGTLFFFILFNNLIGLIPGSLPGTGTMGVTATWAVLVFIIYNWIGFKRNGFMGYLKSFVPSGVRSMPLAARIPLGGFIWLLEFVSHLLRPLTLAVRLFANMYAGHLILGIFGIFVVLAIEALSSSPIVASVSGGLSFVMLTLMYAFEVFVAFIQAYVFAILTAAYIGGAEHAAEH
jgi:F-type H+-transporting ATPase subunit a